MTFFGVLELHNTIVCHVKEDEERFEVVCHKNKLKPIRVLILYDKRYKSEKNLFATKWKGSNDSAFHSFDTRFLLQTSKYITGDLHHAMEELSHITKLLTEENPQREKDMILFNKLGLTSLATLPSSIDTA